MKLVNEVKLNPGYNQEEMLKEVAKICKISIEEIKDIQILKMGIDARKKPDVKIVLNLAIDVVGSAINKLSKFNDVKVDHAGLEYKKINSNIRPVVIGFGPSGMFCALALAMAGLKPIVLERGKCVEERQKDIEKFWNKRELNPNSNVQFGEGGAGTFSDGKLNTTLNNPYCKKVINELILNGAPEEIFYKNKAHIGTDKLKKCCKNIREKIEKLGGRVVFNAKFCDFACKNGEINQIFYENTQINELKTIETNCLILAIGHSALDTFELINNKGVALKQKPFAMGVRIEHKQELINKSQYGEGYSNLLPSADYKLVEHLPNGRSVFTFCMCPGGQVVASSSEIGTIVTNGMSEFARDKEFANSALLVNVNPEDFGSKNVLAGLFFQRKYEKLAYEIAGKNYNAPAMSVGEFLYGKKPKNMNKCSYNPDVTICDITKCLPNFVAESLKLAIPLFDKKIKGFAGNENMLIAIESRSSCPVQFERNENYICTINGLFACGEGAGFAGGIISSAVDGIKCAEKIINKL